MDRIGIVGTLRVGDRVEVMTQCTGTWVGGFEVASTSSAGCHVRRVSDGEVLPAVFVHDDVRLVSEAADLDRDEDSTPAVLIYEGDASTVLRLPAELDVATVAAIRDSVIAAVDEARGEIVLDLDGVQFLDSHGIRLLVTVRRRAWARDLPFSLHGGEPLIRDLLELVGQDPLYHPARR